MVFTDVAFVSCQHRKHRCVTCHASFDCTSMEKLMRQMLLSTSINCLIFFKLGVLRLARMDEESLKTFTHAIEMHVVSR